jgi:hypothetical protein
VARYAQQFPRALIAPKFSWRTLRSHLHQTVKTATGNRIQPQAYTRPRYIESAAKELALPYTPPQTLSHTPPQRLAKTKRKGVAQQPQNLKTLTQRASQRGGFTQAAFCNAYRTYYKSSRVLMKTRHTIATTDSTK